MRLYILALLLFIGATSATNFSVNSSDLLNATFGLDSFDNMFVVDWNFNATCSMTPLVCAPQLNATCVANATLSVTENFSCPSYNFSELVRNYSFVLLENQTVNVTARRDANIALNYSQCWFEYESNTTVCAPAFPDAGAVRDRDPRLFAFYCSDVTGNPVTPFTLEMCKSTFRVITVNDCPAAASSNETAPAITSGSQ